MITVGPRDHLTCGGIRVCKSMVVEEKKNKGEIRTCVDLRKLNDACMQGPFPSPFIDEVLDNVRGKEDYSFIDGSFVIIRS